MRIRLFMLGLLISIQAFSLGNETVSNMSQAKKLLWEVFGQDNRTLYCDCHYDGREIDYGDCSFRPQKDLQRAARVEWEHVVPASAFGRTFREWTQGHSSCRRKGKSYRGRKCAEKTNSTYRKISADLYNLYPSVGEVNGIRANYVMGEIPGEVRKYGNCDFEVSGAIVEPRTEVKGEIARIYFYMEYSYPNRSEISSKLAAMLVRWDEMDPVSEAECQRYLHIREVQGNDNPFLRDRCQQAGWVS